jgi:hypothetical protein
MPNIKGKQWLRITIFILVQPFVPPTGILPIIIHESAHWLTAFFSGVPISEIKFGFYGINPGVSIPSSVSPKVLPYFFYSGGLASGTVLFLIYVFYWVRQYRHLPSLDNWIMSMFTAFSIVIQVYSGILEGKYHEFYGAHISIFPFFLFIIAALSFHAGVFYSLSHFRKKRPLI